MSALGKRESQLRYSGVDWYHIPEVEGEYRTKQPNRRRVASQLIVSSKSSKPRLSGIPGVHGSEIFTEDELIAIDKAERGYGDTEDEVLLKQVSVLEMLRRSYDILESERDDGRFSRCRSHHSMHGSGSMSRTDSLISLKGYGEGDDLDEPTIRETTSRINNVTLEESEQKLVPLMEMNNQVWIYAHAQKEKHKNDEMSVSQFNGSIVAGSAKTTLTGGQKKLKRVINGLSPEEQVIPKMTEKSILDKSYCARQVVEYLRNKSSPLPTFLQEDTIDEYEFYRYRKRN